MTKERNQLRDDLTEDGSGWLSRFLAEEDEFDGRMMWRLASWGCASVGALVVAILATRSPAAMHRDQLAAAELTRQAQQVQWIANESQNKARELAAAVQTLNGDRDRLYARVTVLEQGLDSVTGALARQPAPTPASPTPVAKSNVDQAMQAAATSPAADVPPVGPVQAAESKTDIAALPKIGPVATAPAAPSPAPAKTEEPKADTSATNAAPAATAALPAQEKTTAETAAAVAVRRTEFGVDLGSANSIEGLRAVWRGALKSSEQHLAALHPIIVVKERNDGLGMQLRLVAGPLADAAEAAKLCASLTESNRACETSVYEGQRLSMASEKKPESPAPRPKRKSKPKTETTAEAKPPKSSFSSFFGGR